ncbi:MULTISPECIES: 5-oxoprolinase subunit PxpA [Silvimonas]|uniref:5-oxoprolinase subunit PxpA n=1 Tax=Silvimonas TaxID=300264 RepID=UPI0024B34ACB|nr:MULTISPECIES: 5-oxoprolinase subunit PxpA [Silvimonas]MDR3427116.1 5-oxoprolinase subunit PxpA [Silvimonas sp.]
MARLSIDLNADLGEGYPFDAQLMALISSANVACGGHVGNDASMRSTVRLAREYGVTIGAHPSYPDREHFGRRSLDIDHAELLASLIEQISALKKICAEEGVPLVYVKAHGMLYNDAARDPALADVVIAAIHTVDPQLAVMVLAGSAMVGRAQTAGLRVIQEAFVDRAYRDDGSLVPRSEPGAVLDDDAAAVNQALRFARQSEVQTQSGKVLRLPVDSLCLHGDTPHALQFAQRLYNQLELTQTRK